jgi:hypothetical protein
MIDELIGWYCWFWAGMPKAIFRKFFPEPVRTGDYHWSRYDPIFRPAVKLTDGTWSSSTGTLWRRRRESDDRWEYQQDPETLEEQMNRIA